MRQKIALVLIVLGSIALTSCSGHRTVVVHSSSSPTSSSKSAKVGPPPHAPAHGYRHKHHHGVELVYDSHRDIYCVVKFPNHYYRDECYYREVRGGWEISVITIDGPWKPVAYDQLPPGLAKKVKKSHDHKDGHKHGRKW